MKLCGLRGAAAFVFVLSVVHVAPVAGSGPEMLAAVPIWNLTLSQCAPFRNEAILRPLFILWPESVRGVPFRYCCEYQPIVNDLTASAATFNLSGYRYGAGLGTLMPAPYFDLGLVDRRYKWYWQHWVFWKLPMTRLEATSLYCEVTDVRRLYMHRFWFATVVRAAEGGIVLLAVLLICGIGVPLCRRRRVRWEELFSDVLHVVFLSVVGSGLMEAVAHSAAPEWRAQLMFNGGVAYTYLTLFAMASAVIRHSIRRRSTRRNRKHAREGWRWQKVFGQFAAQFMVAGYLILVEDETARRLEGLACLVLGSVVGATIYSAGVELYVISQFFHFRPIVEQTKGDSDSDSDSNYPV